MTSLEGRVVLVSGVGPGLGREIATSVVRAGGSVVLGARRGQVLAEVAAELPADRVAWHAIDITTEGQPESLVAAAVERFGRVDGLVNVAAVDNVFGGLEDTPLDDWRRAFEVNVFGTMAMTRAALPALKESRGAVVFIGTQSVFYSSRVHIAYAASKNALLAAAGHLAIELGAHGVRVNSVLPGWMWGPPVEQYIADTAAARGVPAEQVRAEVLAPMPLGTMATDGDVAEAVVYFCSDAARAVTGQWLMVNAGQVIR